MPDMQTQNMFYPPPVPLCELLGIGEVGTCRAPSKMIQLYHRPLMTLCEYYAKCARCPFRDMRVECERGQKLRSMPCYTGVKQ